MGRALAPARRNRAGKRVLELGCNMALLSTHLLRESGAAAALAVDRDPAILKAAAEVANTFDVRIELREVDIDGDADWETALAAFSPDVVFCLSVLHWIQEKARLLAFLGRFEELVYEGHDSARSECRRLRAAGYDSIRLVATSERGRPILHCRKREAWQPRAPGRFTNALARPPAAAGR
jgi:SAM-dependent methyltransferase